MKALLCTSGWSGSCPRIPLSCLQTSLFSNPRGTLQLHWTPGLPVLLPNRGTAYTLALTFPLPAGAGPLPIGAEPLLAGEAPFPAGEAGTDIVPVRERFNCQS